MNVLFICGGNADRVMTDGMSPFIRRQGESLKGAGIAVDYFTIQGRGLKSYFRHIFILRKHLKRKAYDVLHAHYGLCGWVALLAFSRLPLVVSFMGSDLYGDVDHRGRTRKKDRLFVILNRFLRHFAHRIIVKSRNLADCLGSGKNTTKKLHILPNGVDFEKFKPMEKTAARRALALGDDQKYVLFLGNPGDPRKNYSLLQLALDRLPGVTPLVPYPVAGDDVPLYLNAADALVLTSFREGSPNVVKEAMACNCPVVSTDAGDAKGVIGNTRGCYIAPFDPAGLAEKIGAALHGEERTTGRDDVRHLEIGAVAEKLADIYHSLLKEYQ